MGWPLRLLLDTRALLWWLTDDERLSTAARRHIANELAEVFVSSASALEIAIKYRLGKLGLAGTIIRRYDSLLAEQGFIHLPVNHEHALMAGNYPHKHRDPFDRLLAAQAEIEGLGLVSQDPAMRGFDVELIW